MALLALALALAPQQTTCPEVVDINQIAVPIDSVVDTAPYDLSAAPNGWLFFAGHQPGTGTELWRTDGTTAGTQLVADLRPGPIGSVPREFGAAGGRVYFGADDGVHGTELWVSDGTPAGTFMLADIDTAGSGSYPRHFTVLGNQVLFVAYKTGFGYELWRTDGTAAGTQLVRDINAGVSSSSPNALTPTPDGTKLVFTAYTNSTGNEPWVTDGTTPGTQALGNLATSSESSMLNHVQFMELGAELYFTAFVDGAGLSLWKTDGTPAGTSLVADTDPSSHDGLFARDHAELGGWIYLRGESAAEGHELWRTNGTGAGTQLAVDIWPGASSSEPDGFTVFGGEVFFFANDNSLFKRALMAYDPVTGLVRHVRELPVVNSSFDQPDHMQVFGGQLVFTVGADGVGREWWVSDGTTAGTQLLADLDGTEEDSTNGNLHVLGDGTAVVLDRGAGAGREVFRMDGHPPGPQLVLDLQPGSQTHGAFPDGMAAFGGNRIAFAASDGISGREPYIMTLGGAPQLLDDVVPGALGSDPENFAWLIVRNAPRLFFTAQESASGREVYVSDGQSVVQLGDFVPGITSSWVSEFADANGIALFEPYATGLGKELWASDGTPGGTAPLKDIEPGPASSDPEQFCDLGDLVLFVATRSSDGRELWVTDGTQAGTQLVVDLHPGSTQPGALTRVGQRAVFYGLLPGPDVKYGLYVSDGTAAGTQLVFDLGGPYAPIVGAHFPVVDDHVYFVRRSVSGYALWRSDLTAAGTQFVAQLGANTSASSFGEFVAAGSKVFFKAEIIESGVGEELYVSDGTAAGTHLVADLAPSAGDSRPEWITAVGERVYFTAFGPGGLGRELYVSDGVTIDLVCDPTPGSGLGSTLLSPSAPGHLVAVGGQLVFQSLSPHGAELHVLEMPGAHTTPLAPNSTGVLLELGTPVLGGTAKLRVSGGPPGARVAAFSLPTPAPVWTPALHPGHLLWLSPSALTTVGTTSAATLETSVSVPADPGLSGVRLHVQGGVFDPALIGIVLSNGVEAVLGL